MQHKIKKLPNSRVEVEVTLTAEEMESFFKEAKKKLTEGRVVKGFRPGKAPAELTLTDDDIYNEAAHLAMNKIYPEILDKEKLDTIGPAKADILKIARGNDFIFKLESAIFPEVRLPEYKKIAESIIKEKRDSVIEDKEVNEAIDWLRKSRAKVTPVDRPSKLEDFIEIEVFNSLEKKDFDDSKPGEKDAFILGKNKHLLVGFEKEITGMKKGEKRSFSLVANNDHWDEKIRGKTVNFLVKMNLVGNRELPELSDEFAKSLGKFENMEEVKKSIREGILKEKDMKEKDRIRLKTIEAISEKTKIELPEEMIKLEVENQFHEIGHLASEQGLSMEQYLAKIGKEEKEFKESLAGPSEKNVKQMLILREIAQKENIKPSIEEIENEKTVFLNRYNSEEADKIDKNRLEDYIINRLANEKVFQFLESV